ncbi:MAG TPA: ATPase, T2SS/T4P/T4SS family [Myxococcota bacterium]|nr:ATPase, T2SS/T4P/T4SS family [Myxococcota bacterium]HRY94793.1 ATPase, T2SS/T4P/T4SS family [Myxococcota bacterium]
MLSISINEKGGAAKRRDFQKDEITIGRIQGNDIVLPRGNISKKHARIVARDGKMVILDLKSTNGTFVNGKRISAPQVVRPSDKIAVGDFIVQVLEPGAAGEAEADEGAEERPARGGRAGEETDAPDFTDEAEPLEEDEGTSAEGTDQKPQPRPPKATPKPAAPPPPEEKPQVVQVKARDPKVEKYSELQREVHQRLIEYLDLRRMDIEQLNDEELWNQTERAIRDIIVQMENDVEIPDWVDRERLVNDVLNEALGLGPLEEFLADPTISEIMVNHSKQIYIERAGKLRLSDKTFSSNTAVLGVIERIVAPIGRRIDESSPLVDARLKDGSRVNAIIPPLALKGPCITIRKFKKEALAVSQLIKFNTLTAGMGEFLEMCVKARRNMVVSGGTGSGKTTTLNCLSAFIPDGERIVTVEDAAELQIKQDHWVQLESRPANIEGKGQITIRDLVKNCLRMRPDRIVVGECRGGETLDMLQAMNTGHDGSLTTLHANTPRDALARLETMVLMSGMELPVRAIREQIASAVNMIVQQTRFSDGTRKITNITEVTGMEVDIVTLQDIFYFKQEGFAADNKVKGKYVATGFIPKFYDEMQRKGIPVNMDIFREQ